MAGPSTTTTSVSSVCFPHVASIPTNIDCVEQPAPLSDSHDYDVESRCNEHFPLNIDSDWRTIWECDTYDIEGTTVVPSDENTCIVSKEANTQDCGTVTAETIGLDPECSWKMDTTTSNESCDVEDSSVSTSDLLTFIDPDPRKSVAVYSSPKLAPPPTMPIADIRLQTSAGYCAIDAPSEFISASAISVTVPMATHITTCVPLISTCQMDYNVSLSLLPSLQLVTTTSLLSSVTVVLVATDSGATYVSSPAEVLTPHPYVSRDHLSLAPQPYDSRDNSSLSWPDSPAAGPDLATVSGDTSSQCCRVSWSRRHPLTSVTYRHVEESTSPCVFVASQPGCRSRLVSESVSVYGPCVHSSRVTSKDDLVTRLDPGVSFLTPHVGVVCSSMIPSSASIQSPAQPLTITARVSVPFMADSSGRLTVLPSRVTSIISDRLLECDAKQTRRQNNKRHDKSTVHITGSHRVAMQRNGGRKKDTLVKSHLESPVKQVQGSGNVDHADPYSQLIPTPVDTCMAPPGERSQDVLGDSLPSVSRESSSNGLYSAVVFPQTSCMVVGCVSLPRVSSRCCARIRCRRNVTRRSNSRGECDFLPSVSPVTSCSFAMLSGATSHDSPSDYINDASSVSRHHCTLEPDHCSEAWRNAHAVPRDTDRRHGYQPALYPLPPVIMAPGIFRCPKVWLSILRLVISNCSLNAF